MAVFEVWCMGETHQVHAVSELEATKEFAITYIDGIEGRVFVRHMGGPRLWQAYDFEVQRTVSVTEVP